MGKKSAAKPGYVYVLGNPAFTHLLKIGRTRRHPAIRAGELSSGTGVPGSFQVIYFEYFEDYVQAESDIHRILKKWRYADNREFFTVEASKAIKTIQDYKRLVGKPRLTKWGLPLSIRLGAAAILVVFLLFLGNKMGENYNRRFARKEVTNETAAQGLTESISLAPEERALPHREEDVDSHEKSENARLPSESGLNDLAAAERPQQKGPLLKGSAGEEYDPFRFETDFKRKLAADEELNLPKGVWADTHQAHLEQAKGKDMDKKEDAGAGEVKAKESVQVEPEPTAEKPKQEGPAAYPDDDSQQEGLQLQ